MDNKEIVFLDIPPTYPEMLLMTAMDHDDSDQALTTVIETAIDNISYIEFIFQLHAERIQSKAKPSTHDAQNDEHPRGSFVFLSPIHNTKLRMLDNRLLVSSEEIVKHAILNELERRQLSD